MIKILYIIVCLKPGGSEKYLLDLVKHLNPEQYKVTVWCEEAWGPAGDEMRKAGATVIQRPNRPIRPDHVLRNLRFIRGNRFDIVHSLKYNANFVDPLVCKLSRVKVFMTSRRNLRHWAPPPKLRMGDRLRNAMTDHIIANSETVKDLTIALEHLPATKISVIYTGVDLEEVDATVPDSGRAFRSSLGIPNDAVVVGTVADLREAKGQSYLVKAFVEVVRKTNKDVYLVIQGEGPEESNLRSLVKELKIEGRVRICEVMRSFDIFVLPSLNERFSNVIIAAMAMSLPCIASDVGGNPEAVVHNVSGLIVPVKSIEPLAEAVLRLVDDPVLAKEFGAKGRELVEKKYTVQRMAAEHERLYSEMVGKD
jgi:glycosyltransferase involved in cell wall biosynthesis